MIEKAPIRFHPYMKPVLWGGERISEYKGLSPRLTGIGESWEISAVPGHVSVVAEGPYEGLTLNELIDRFGVELLGEKVIEKYNGRFPLLIKFIDAADNLSVQVHPGDKLAMERHNCMGKTEMWYIIDNEAGAKIYSGLNRKISKEEYGRLVEDEEFHTVLAVHDSHPGDVFMIPGGRVHSIGAGNLLAEIQESSDVTYRIYDYGRTDADGKKRELHADLAKDAIDYNVYSDYKSPRADGDEDYLEIARCGHFTAHRLQIDGTKELRLDPETFSVLICISGEVKATYPSGESVLSAGHSLLLPAALPAITLSGRSTLILTRC